MKAERLVQLLAACEEARIRLEVGIAKNLHGDDLAALVAERVAALEALAEHQQLVPSADGAFVLHAERRGVKHNRRNRSTKPAA
jgi:hypothetical protein